MLGEAYENNKENLWLVGRQIEFANYCSSVNSMNGKQNFKKLKKPSDLYSLPSDKIEPKKKQEVVIPTQEHALRKIREAHKIK